MDMSILGSEPELGSEVEVGIRINQERVVASTVQFLEAFDSSDSNSSPPSPPSPSNQQSESKGPPAFITQYNGFLKRGTTNLYRHVIYEAIHSYNLHYPLYPDGLSRGDKEQFEFDRWWIYQREYDYLLSFENLCGAVGIQAHFIRRKMKKLQKVYATDREFGSKASKHLVGIMGQEELRDLDRVYKERECMKEGKQEN